MDGYEIDKSQMNRLIWGDNLLHKIHYIFFSIITKDIFYGLNAPQL